MLKQFQQAKVKLEAMFPPRRKKAIEDWDFIMVFEQYYKQQIQIYLERIKCKEEFQWKVIDNEEEKQSLFILKFSDRVVADMAHQLKILKKKDKVSYQFKLKDLNTLIHTTQRDKSPHVYDYLCFIRARMFPNNKAIYEQQKYSAFNKNKKQKYFKQPNGRLFTEEEQLKAKYHFLLTYEEKINQYKGQLQSKIAEQTKQPFMDIMKLSGFIELVPIQRVSQYKVLIFGSLKEYLGPNIDCYFDFVAFMQGWLIFPMILGLLTVFINYFYEYTAENSPVQFLYALLVMIWSILFITKWEQVEKWLQIKQNSGSSDLWSENQNMINRGGLQRQVSQVTGRIQNYLPLKKRLLLGAIANGICLAQIVLTIIFMIYSLNARGFIDPDHKLFYSETISGWALPGGIFDKNTFWGQIPNTVHVLVLNMFDEMAYRPISKKLARFQSHKTSKGYENSIILKYFVYQFIITFADLFYIAFVRFDINGLRQQLLSLFFIDIIRRVVSESILPWVKKKRRSNSIKSSFQVSKMTYDEELRCGVIIQVNKQTYEPFDDYLQIITNIGYLVMISSCFPLAPTLILLAHAVQLIQDKYKIVHIFKRKLPQKYVGMGRWKDIIVFLCYFSILTNIMLFAFSSQQVVSVFPLLFENGKDLLYGNTDLSTLFQGAATNVFQSMMDLSGNTTAGASIALGALFNIGTDQSVGLAEGFMGNFKNFNNDTETENNEKVDDGWGDSAAPPNIQLEKKQSDGWDQFVHDEESAAKLQEQNSEQSQVQPAIGSPMDAIFGGGEQQPLKGNLHNLPPPTQKEQITVIAILFFIEHFFLLGFILLRNTLAKKKSPSDIFLERRDYKRRIKKNLPKEVLSLLSGTLMINSLLKNKTPKTPNNSGQKTGKVPTFRKSDSEEQQQGATVIDLILKAGEQDEKKQLQTKIKDEFDHSNMRKKND